MSVHAPVHWHEVMFLRLQHFQVAEQNFQHLIRDNLEWSRHYSWGLRRFRLDQDALANHRVVISELAARMRDGTLISSPESGRLPEVDLRVSMVGKQSLTLFVAIPKLQTAQPTLSAASRYRVESLDLEDVNTGQNPRPIQIRRLNLQSPPRCPPSKPANWSSDGWI